MPHAAIATVVVGGGENLSPLALQSSDEPCCISEVVDLVVDISLAASK